MRYILPLTTAMMLAVAPAAFAADTQKMSPSSASSESSQQQAQNANPSNPASANPNSANPSGSAMSAAVSEQKNVQISNAWIGQSSNPSQPSMAYITLKNNNPQELQVSQITSDNPNVQFEIQNNSKDGDKNPSDKNSAQNSKDKNPSDQKQAQNSKSSGQEPSSGQANNNQDGQPQGDSITLAANQTTEVSAENSKKNGVTITVSGLNAQSMQGSKEVPFTVSYNDGSQQKGQFTVKSQSPSATH